MTSPTISVLPTKKLIALLKAEGHPNAAAVISMSAARDDFACPFPCHVEVYEDIDREVPGRSLSPEAAGRIAGFVERIEANAQEVFVCCDAGESRSPAIAAAILLHWGRDDMDIWRSPHFHPNMYVFECVVKAFGIAMADYEVEYRYQINAQVFRQAIRQARK